MEPQTFIFFGIIGSGKGTQVKLLMEFLKNQEGRECVYAYPGNEYRRLIESGNYTGKLIKDSMAQGHLQPDFLTDSIVVNILISSIEPDKHLIADGYPRTLVQAESFEKMLKFFKRDQVKLIYIKISEEEATKRNLLRGRHDDTQNGIAQRIEEYRNKVIPSMDYFKGKPGYEICTINGEQSREDVYKDIIKALGY